MSKQKTVMCRMCKADAVNGRTCCQKHLDYNAARQSMFNKNQMVSRRAKNLCPRCGANVGGRRTYCQKCLTDQRAWRDKRVKDGICKCGKQIGEGGHCYCKRCRAKISASTKSLWESRVADGICGKCGIEKLDSKRQWCRKCSLKASNKRELSIKSGKCGTCHTNRRIDAHTSCEVCWFKEKATIHLGDRKRWVELKDLFASQNGICEGTGIKMKIGIDASVDHLIPPKRGGSVNDISNLRFVVGWYNLIKADSLHEEFREKIKLIYDRMFLK